MQDETTTATVAPEQGTSTEAQTTTATVQAPEAQPTGQTDSQGPSTDESFFDPNAIPEELKPAYKQMQAAFTKKTQEIAEARKQADAVKQQAESYAKYEQYVPILEEMLNTNQRAKTQPNVELAPLEQQLKAAGYSDEAVEMMKMAGSFFLNQFNQTLQTRDQQASAQSQQQALQAKIAEAGTIDPRLSDQSLVYTSDDGQTRTFGNIVEALVNATPNWQQDVVASTRNAIKLVDAMIGQAKVQGKTELSQAAKQKAQKFPATQSSSQSARSDGDAATIQDAFKIAKQELGM